MISQIRALRLFASFYTGAFDVLHIFKNHVSDQDSTVWETNTSLRAMITLSSYNDILNIKSTAWNIESRQRIYM